MAPAIGRRSRSPAPDLAAAVDRRLPDILQPSLDIVFCGINPGLYSAALGHHFARPGNRFWPTLYRAGLTPCLLTPDQDVTLPRYGLGLTNIVARPTVRAAALSPDELQAGALLLQQKITSLEPRILAILGITAYRQAFQQPRARLGFQDQLMGRTRICVLPNPSGLNAHFQLAELATLFATLKTIG